MELRGGNMLQEASKTLVDFVKTLKDDTRKTLTVAVAGGVGCLAAYKLVQSLRSRSPPGPVGIPGLGVMPQVMWRTATDPRYRLFKLTTEFVKRYGDIVSFRMGTQEFVLLSGYEVITEALISMADRFSDRPHTSVHMYLNDGNHGLVTSDGEMWQEHRRFALRVLRDFGFGKTVSELRIQEECEHLVNMMRQMDGQDVDMRPPMAKAVANVISVMLFSRRNSFEDPEMDEMLKSFGDFVHMTLSDSLGILFPQIPSHRSLGRILVNKRQFEASKWLTDKCRRSIDEIRKTFNPSDQPQNYIEAFLAEQTQQSGNPKTQFTDTQLLKSMRDLYIAGTDTTSNTLCWALLYAALHPQCQERCHKEIVDKIGGSRQVNLKDKKELPYCLAFLDETQRLSTLVPRAVEHRVSQDTEFRGFTISSKAIVFIDLYGVHHDPRLFPNPDSFDPTRFLDESGAYKTSEFLIPFGVGRRSCLGEALAKMELFLFFVSLLQNFRLEATEETLKQKDEILLGEEGLVHSPMSHTLKVSCYRA